MVSSFLARYDPENNPGRSSDSHTHGAGQEMFMLDFHGYGINERRLRKTDFQIFSV